MFGCRASGGVRGGRGGQHGGCEVRGARGQARSTEAAGLRAKGGWGRRGVGGARRRGWEAVWGVRGRRLGGGWGGDGGKEGDGMGWWWLLAVG